MKNSEIPSDDLIAGLRQFISSQALVAPGDRVLLAVSGGIDSMVMLDLFRRIREELDLSLAVVHVNHQLRGEESDGDEDFVRSYAESAGLQFLSERIDVTAYRAGHALSKQEAARALRYAAFERVRVETGSHSVATAHHADDNAETVLMNALRGTGIRGLAGIPLRREPGSIVRPLLFAYRNAINAYANARGVTYRDDSSNTSRGYTRNRLRHEVLPFLSDHLQTDAARSLNRVSSLMRSLQEVLSAETTAFAASAVSVDPKTSATTLSIAELKRRPLFLQDELILLVLRSIGVEPTAQKVQACLALCEQLTGRTLDLSAGWTVLRDRDHLMFSKPIKAEAFEQHVEIGHEYEFPGFRIALRELPEVPARLDHPPLREFADADRLGSRLLVRSWREGDWFIPLGMSGRKKLSDFFVNSKVSGTAKRSTPILESDGDIVWVCGLRLDQRFSITPATKKAVELMYQPRSAQ